MLVDLTARVIAPKAHMRDEWGLMCYTVGIGRKRHSKYLLHIVTALVSMNILLKLLKITFPI